MLVCLKGRCSGFIAIRLVFTSILTRFDLISNSTNLEVNINRNSFDLISCNATIVIHSITGLLDPIPQNATSRLPSIPNNVFNPDLGSELVHFLCIRWFFLNSDE